MNLLRYRSRHTLHFPGCWAWPVLNPIGRASHNKITGERTWEIDEPRWLYRLRQRLFCIAGRHACPDRSGRPRMPGDEGPTPDTWRLMADGNRTCSYCGSMHPADLMKHCAKVIADPAYTLEMSDKAYKAYVSQPGVPNASHGAIKFYMWHVPSDVTEADQKLFAEARRISRERFVAQYAQRRAG